MKNSLIIHEFENLIKQIEYDIDNTTDKKEKITNLFRLKQISNALEIIKKFPTQIKNGEELKDIKGIGKGIINRINEILNEGHLNEIIIGKEDFKKSKYIDNLKEVYGIGEITAHDFVYNHNIKNVDELKKAYKEGKIKLNHNILVGLKYYGEYKQQIPRTEMKKMDKLLKKTAKNINSKLEVKICGSYRRKKPFSNDIDCMLTHPKIKTMNDLKNKKNYLNLFVRTLEEISFIIDSLTSETVETKFMGFCRYSEKTSIRRIDIRYLPYDSYYYALLYFTGSGSFNQKMRQIAKRKGFKLNEYGLYKKDKNGKYNIFVPVNSEKEIFEKLGMEYKEPIDRI
jgi:DNA polymerase/3'-5' exonuclease PolX